VAFLALAFALFLFAFDFQNLLAWRRSRVLEPAEAETTGFTVLVPLYGDPRYFAERRRLEHLKSRVLVALDLGAEPMAAFARTLER
jgi:hypothetical protein